jgi:hypothetical protein
VRGADAAAGAVGAVRDLEARGTQRKGLAVGVPVDVPPRVLQRRMGVGACSKGGKEGRQRMMSCLCMRQCGHMTVA